MLKKFIIAFIVLVSFVSLSANKGDKAEAAYFHTKAVKVAKANLGVPYRWGGTSPRGFDCSGLIKYSYARAGKTLNRTAAQMFSGNGHRIYKYIKPGDLMFYAPNKASKPTHVSMYIGNGKMIMASSSKGVMITNTNNSYWHPRYIGTKRI